MGTIDYSHKKIFLDFYDFNVECVYRLFAIKRTLVFSRIAWCMVLFFSLTFSFLDRISFGEKASEVFIARIFVVAVASLMLLLSYNEKYRQFLIFNSFVFINLVGLFSIYLTLISSPLFFTPYLIGIVMAFTGVFINTGIGFKHSLNAIIGVTAFFTFSVLFIAAHSIQLILVYTVFISTLAIIFVYIAYLVEKIFRENFAYSVRLKDSLHKVTQLSGFLPICAKCKKIRDDEGYWNQVEKYISEHSDAEFTHSLCPKCSDSIINEVEVQYKMTI